MYNVYLPIKKSHKKRDENHRNHKKGYRLSKLVFIVRQVPYIWNGKFSERALISFYLKIIHCLLLFISHVLVLLISVAAKRDTVNNEVSKRKKKTFFILLKIHLVSQPPRIRTAIVCFFFTNRNGSK